MLSIGEQQGSACARLLYAPDYLSGRATASLDEPGEAALYQLLDRRLANATIVSIGHRATLAAFHKRRLAFNREGDHYAVREANSRRSHKRKLDAPEKEEGRRPITAAAPSGQIELIVLPGCRA
jgi:ABC-type uncharacterized transport system fused permease/ATPase subunit